MKHINKLNPIIIALTGSAIMMVLTTCMCMYAETKRIENTEKVYKSFEDLGFSLVNNYEAVHHSKLALLQMTLSEPLCILAILLMGIATFVAILLDNQGMNE